MYNIDYNIGECFNFYGKLIGEYPIFNLILMSMIVLGIVMIMNIKNDNNLMLTILFNIVSVALTFYYFKLEIINHLDTCLDQGLIGNICFYFINTNIALFVISAWLTSKCDNYAFKFTLIILYLGLLLNIYFALYVTYSMNQIILITLGNIYPMIIIGNLASFGVYLYLILMYLAERYRKYYDKKKHLLYK